MQSKTPLDTVPDDELLRRLADLLRHSRSTEADLVAHIGEVDARGLYAREASPSMYAYCTEVLHLSEAEAYLRIAAARASRAHPVVLEMLADGRLHLSAIAKLAPHLTAENRDDLLRRATHKSKREVEEVLAERQPRPDVPSSIRKLPERRIDTSAVGLRPGKDASNDSGGLASLGPPPLFDEVAEPDPEVPDAAFGACRPATIEAPAAARSRPATIEPLSAARYKVQFTASAELRDKLERLRALMRSSVPDGDLGAVIEKAVTEKLERLEAQRFGRVGRKKAVENQGVSRQRGPVPPETAEDGVGPDREPVSGTGEAAPNAAGPDLPTVAEPARGEAGVESPPPASRRAPRSRYIPAKVRRAVYARDGGRCHYANDEGRRCMARERIHFHHRHPLALGGEHSVENVGLVCATHNRHLAEVDYGRKAMARYRGGREST